MPKSRPSSKKAPRLAEWNGLSTYDARAVEPLFRLLSGLSAGCWQATEYLQGEEGIDGSSPWMASICSDFARAGCVPVAQDFRNRTNLHEVSRKALPRVLRSAPSSRFNQRASWRQRSGSPTGVSCEGMTLDDHIHAIGLPSDGAIRTSVGRSSPGPVDRLLASRSASTKPARSKTASSVPGGTASIPRNRRWLRIPCVPSSRTGRRAARLHTRGRAAVAPRRSSRRRHRRGGTWPRRPRSRRGRSPLTRRAVVRARDRSGVGAPVQQVRQRRHVPPRVAHARRPGRTSMTPRLTRLFDSRAPLAGALLVTRSSRCVGPRSTRRGEGRDRR